MAMWRPRPSGQGRPRVSCSLAPARQGVDTQFLNTFVAVADRGSMAAAARLLNITPAAVAQQIRAVENGELDAAIVLEAPFALPKTCGWQLLREEPLVVLAPQSLAGRDPHELLATQPLIRYDRNQWGGRQADQYLRLAGIVPRERLELNALNAIAVMVDRGLGVSLVPDWARPWPEGLKLARIPLPREFEPRRIGIVWSRSTIRLRLVTAFLHESRVAMKGQAGGPG